MDINLPVTRHLIIEGNCNGNFKIATDFTTVKEQKEFHKIYDDWFDDPSTEMWCIESFIIYFKKLHPKRMCILYSEYIKIIMGRSIPSTKQDWERENN